MPIQLPEMSPESRRLAMDFFELFARTEYALKENGDFERRDGRVIPNWTALAGRCAAEFERLYENDETLRNAVAAIEADPPKAQFVRARRLCWRRMPIPANASRASKVAQYLNIIRNNLFHGGKLGSVGWHNETRTINLLSPALVVLEHLIRADQAILAYVEGRA